MLLSIIATILNSTIILQTILFSITVFIFLSIMKLLFDSTNLLDIRNSLLVSRLLQTILFSITVFIYLSIMKILFDSTNLLAIVTRTA